MDTITFSTDKIKNSLSHHEEKMYLKKIRDFRPISLEHYANEVEKIELEKNNKFSVPQTLTIDNLEKQNTENVLLDLPLRELFEDFILVWNKIIIDLLSESLFKFEKEPNLDWWIILYRHIVRIISVFWVKDRIMHVGIGLIIASFFFFFIFVTQ